MQLWMLVIVCFAALQINSPVVEANSVESFESFQDEGNLRSYVEENQSSSGFAGRIKDWFRRLKNRILGRPNSQNTPPPIDPRKMGNLDTDDLRIVQGNPGGFFLDMSRVRFDPQKDWGFRVGKWYFIRKVSVDSGESKDWSTAEIPDPEWTTVDKAQRTGDDRTTETVKSRETTATPSPTVKSSPEVTEFQYPTTTSASITEATSEAIISTIEYSTTNDVTTKLVTPASVTTKNPKDNETHKRKPNSAEVIGPS